jgi:hypothetical protein
MSSTSKELKLKYVALLSECATACKYWAWIVITQSQNHVITTSCATCICSKIFNNFGSLYVMKIVKLRSQPNTLTWTMN